MHQREDQDKLKTLKIVVLTLFFALATSVAPKADAADFDQCRDMFAYGMLPAADFSSFQPADLCFDSFAVLHSGASKTPLYVAQHLTRARLIAARGEERTDSFYPEARLPIAHRAQLEDYRGSGFDRGHMAPAADMPNPNAMAQSFSLANMVPQAASNNRGPWADIEQATRKYVMRTGADVYVLTGPVFTREHRKIGPNQVWVPDFLYKLVYDATSNRAWAYWMANDDSKASQKPISYSELVQRLGFHPLQMPVKSQ